ncbi:DoxX family protein [Aureitalea sp. L0-47]|uniref:DoxX family protein n=1 Tax=Aureitalea sp. L0-47 TaxID=2816962 RepID=UPI0022390965|nr:DoxX family protein [Aureitalea sp. L0-47]MCW5519559.1 DoxX family protein [Aureitalea sp. L0-47]
MGTIKTWNKWANRHSYYPLDFLRIALGVFLFIKGINFMGNTQMLLELVQPLQSIGGEMIMIHYVAPAHFVGGLLIAFGLLTRWAILAQLPILVGAILINAMGDLNSFDLIMALLTFIVCVFFLFFGSGKHSVDYSLKMQK